MASEHVVELAKAVKRDDPKAVLAAANKGSFSSVITLLLFQLLYDVMLLQFLLVGSKMRMPSEQKSSHCCTKNAYVSLFCCQHYAWFPQYRPERAV
jgi:hypothetical protein